MGRTGTFFAFEQTPITPDAVTLAKGLAGGIPIGALLTTERAASFRFGDHGTTLGGNPVSCAAAVATLRVIDEQGLMANARARGAQLADGLAALVADGVLSEVRGRGLMIGLETAEPIARAAMDAARERHGLLVNATGDTTLRLVPPLNIGADEVDLAIERLGAALADARSAA